jgi:hypothetical protein
MTDPSRAGPSPELQLLSIPPARPRATAFVLGIALIAIVGVASTVAFLVPPSKLVFGPSHFKVAASTAVAVIGVVAGLVGLIFLFSGNIRRLRLIYEFSVSAAELTATVTEEGKFQADFDHREQVKEWLGDYEKALLRLGAYEQALQVSEWIYRMGGRIPHNLRRYFPRRLSH